LAVLGNDSKQTDLFEDRGCAFNMRAKKVGRMFWIKASNTGREMPRGIFSARR
jgi:hypothetical protein